MAQENSTKNIWFTTDVNPASNRSTGSITIKNIRYEDGSKVAINGFLGFRFVAPDTKGKDIVFSSKPWADLARGVHSDMIPGRFMAYDTTIELWWPGPHLFEDTDEIYVLIPGDLVSDLDFYLSSIRIYADHLPGREVLPA